MIWLTVGGTGWRGAAVRVRPAIAAAPVRTVAARTAASVNSSRRLGDVPFAAFRWATEAGREAGVVEAVAMGAPPFLTSPM